MEKTVLITGATGGIGYAAAKAMAKKGHRLILQGRDSLKGEQIAMELSKIKGSNISFVQADVSTVNGMKALAKEIKLMTNKIDVFIQATGTLNSERKETSDGLYESFAVNYLCKFMLDHLLLPELKRGEGRIIIVGGPIRRGAIINFSDLHMKKNYSLMKSIGQNMLAIHMHAQEFSKQNSPDISINVTNAGVVKTGIDRNIKGIMKLVFRIVGPIIGNSIDDAIINVLALVETDSIASGYFYPKVAEPAIKVKIDENPIMASRLQQVSESLVKLKI